MKRLTMGIIAGFSLIIIVVLLYVALYVYSASTVEVRALDVQKLSGVSLEGFTLGGDIEVYNDGIVVVGVDHIEYQVTLKQNNIPIASGNIDGGTLGPKEAETFSFTSEIEWVPSLELITQLITSSETTATINGTVYVMDALDIKVPFETEIDISQYLSQFLMEGMKDDAEGLIDTFKSILGFE